MSDVEASAIFGPFLAMGLLTLVVWVTLYVRRIGYMVSAKIHPDRVITPEKLAAEIPDAVNYPANNLKNLFELPVLFYALCLYLYVTASVDTINVVAAWLFVLFRAMHSYVHCTSMRVMNRFRLYMLASIALWFMLLRAGAQYVF